jgi:hypothetical protein
MFFVGAPVIPGKATWVEGDLGTPPLTPYQVGPGQTYTTIQSAIDAAALAGAALPDAGALVLVAPGAYAEDVVMAPSVFVQSTGDGTTFIDGSVTVDFPDEGAELVLNKTGLTGITVRAVVNGTPAFSFTGAYRQECFLVQSVLQITAGLTATQALYALNTGGSSSRVLGVSCVLTSAVAGDLVGPLLEMAATNTASVELRESRIEGRPPSPPAPFVSVLNEDGPIRLFDSYVFGTVAINFVPGLSFDISTMQGGQIFALGTGVVVTGTLNISGTVIDPFGGLLVDASSGGVVQIGVPLSTTVGAFYLPPGITGNNVVATTLWQGSKIPNGTWDTVPATEQEAFDRMAAAIAVLLGGPIP